MRLAGANNYCSVVCLEAGCHLSLDTENTLNELLAVTYTIKQNLIEISTSISMVVNRKDLLIVSFDKFVTSPLSPFRQFKANG
jgi:hypothetical protein